MPAQGMFWHCFSRGLKLKTLEAYHEQALRWAGEFVLAVITGSTQLSPAQWCSMTNPSTITRGAAQGLPGIEKAPESRRRHGWPGCKPMLLKRRLFSPKIQFGTGSHDFPLMCNHPYQLPLTTASIIRRNQTGHTTQKSSRWAGLPIRTLSSIRLWHFPGIKYRSQTGPYGSIFCLHAPLHHAGSRRVVGLSWWSGPLLTLTFRHILEIIYTRSSRCICDTHASSGEGAGEPIQCETTSVNLSVSFHMPAATKTFKHKPGAVSASGGFILEALQATPTGKYRHAKNSLNNRNKSVGQFQCTRQQKSLLHDNG